jgi:hypothetical protein
MFCHNLCKLAALEATARRLVRNSQLDSPEAILGTEWCLLAMKARREHLLKCWQCRQGIAEESFRVQ